MSAEAETARRITFDRLQLLQGDYARLQATYELAAKKNREHVRIDDAYRVEVERLRADLKRCRDHDEAVCAALEARSGMLHRLQQEFNFLLDQYRLETGEEPAQYRPPDEE